MVVTENNEIGRIAKRAIEARAVAPVIEALAKRIGHEEALKILAEVNEREAFLRGKAIRDTLGHPGIAELAEDVATWGKGGEMEIEILEQTATTFSFNVTRCPYYEKYKELGLLKYGVAFSCCRDLPFAQGFHPQLHLERSQTIMEGADYCDFRYYIKE